jgi:hypothetical protein
MLKIAQDFASCATYAYLFYLYSNLILKTQAQPEILRVAMSHVQMNRIG